MKGFFRWFKNSSKMKRWMFIIVIGILLACYGIAEILVLKEISFKEVGKIIVIFIVGFLAIITGLVGLNKRTLEVLVESTDERMENKKNVNETISIVLCILWSVVWWLITANEKIYSVIKMPVWILLLGIALLILGSMIYRVLHDCTRYWEGHSNGFNDN
mgnify:CR=1 FL=1